MLETARSKDMVTIRFTERRGAVLTPSGLACLAGVPTVNISTGCAHRCVYCYGRGYSQYPGDRTVLVYRDTAARVEKELARKRRRPAAVYFCPSCDAFQPVDAVLEESYRTMHVLLESGVGVEFISKGAIPGRFLDLFNRHQGRVSAQVGLTTLDDSLRATLEPGAAPPPSADAPSATAPPPTGPPVWPRPSDRSSAARYATATPRD
jgi:DNA repair photolyase